MSTQQDGAPLKRVESYQYPSGHVGHLTQNQQDALQRFKDVCAAKKYYTPATDSAPPSHDDETLLRYLRARKFIPEEAFGQLKDTEDWRKENQIDTLYETIDIDEYDTTRRLYPQWLGRRDKRGIPVYLFEVAHLDNKAVSANANSTEKKGQTNSTSKVPPKMLRLFALYENLCRFVLPLCSTVPDRPYPETPISQSSNIVDISNVGLRQFWNLKNHMQDASLLATAHYPETLDRIFLIGAPSFFPTVWSWIKRWFDPITVSKIFILSAAEVKPTLLQYIDEDNIPKKYGGKLDFKFGDMPMLEPAIADNMEWQDNTRKGDFRSFPAGPIKWERGADGTMHAVAVGTQNGVKRNIPIAGVRPDATAAQSSLAPGRASRVDLIRTTTGEATHPPTPPPAAAEVKPDDLKGDDLTSSNIKSSDVTDPDLNEGKTDNAEVPGTSRMGTYTVSFRDAAGERSQPPEVREGTSETRFEQQQATHAADKLAEGTPEVRHMGHGDKINVMEPSTIGQAPKEHPVHSNEEPPSVIDQAKDVAGQVYAQASTLPSTVLSAVGMGEKKPAEEPQTQEPGKKHDPVVDSMDERKVEEFLRAKNMSKPQEPGNQG